jgi:hypothetical protein
MIELLGTVWFLGALYLWSSYHQKIIGPWPQWTVFPLAFPFHWVGVVVIAGVTGRMFG